VLSPLIHEATAQAIVYIDPPSVEGYLPGDSFTLVVIVDIADNVYSWEFFLSFAPFIEVLNVTEVSEGDFLQMAGDVTYFTYDLDNYAGLLKASATIIGDVPGVSGGGILAYVTFKVVGGGESPLDLHDTLLLDPQRNQVAHTVTDSYFNGMAPYAYFTYTPSPESGGYEPSINETVTFNATDSYDPDGGSVVSYHWDFDDGNITTVTEPIIQHNYPTPASNINVNLTIQDNSGYQDSFTKLINVVVRDITIANVEVSPTGKVKAGTLVDIDVRAENIGTGTESFNVTAYYNDVEIETQEVINLNPIPPSPPWRHRINLTFTWDTTGLPTGDYTIKVVAYTFPGELNLTNNEFIWGTIAIAETSSLLFKTIVYGATFDVLIETDSEGVSGFAFNYTQRKILFTVTGTGGFASYSNVSIPMTLLNVSDPLAWIVTINGTTTDFVATSNGTHYFVYLSYTFASAYTINVVGTKVPIPPQPVLSMPTRALAGNSVTLNGTASTDPDGHGIKEYFWEAYTLTPFGEKDLLWSATTTIPTVAVVFNESAITVSVLRVTLTVTNNLGLKNTTRETQLEVFYPFDVAIVDVATSQDISHLGENLMINVTVTSLLNTHGDAIMFVIGIYGNGSLLRTELVPSTMPREIVAPSFGQNRIVSLLWNTTNVALGAYSLRASISVVQYSTLSSFPAEFNASNNAFVYEYVHVKKWDVAVGIVVSPSTITVGENVVITGTLSPVLQGVDVTVQYKFGDIPSWLNAGTVSTNTLGQYSFNWTPELAKTYEIRIVWAGDNIHSSNVSVTKNLVVKQAFSEISIEVASTQVNVGSHVTISGKITPETSGVTVTIKARKDGGSWVTLSAVATDAQGNYAYEWLVSEAGAYEIQTSWAGNVNTAGSDSVTKTVQAETSGLPMTYVYVAVGVVVVVAISLAVYLLRKRRP